MRMRVSVLQLVLLKLVSGLGLGVVLVVRRVVVLTLLFA